VKQKRQQGDPKRNYAREWRQWRTKHKLTQAQLADVLLITRRTITNIETGRTRPRVSVREKMKALQARYREAQA
jgi:DNA-binding XRE family transcriptional regulator